MFLGQNGLKKTTPFETLLLTSFVNVRTQKFKKCSRSKCCRTFTLVRDPERILHLTSKSISLRLSPLDTYFIAFGKYGEVNMQVCQEKRKRIEAVWLDKKSQRQVRCECFTPDLIPVLTFVTHGRERASVGSVLRPKTLISIQARCTCGHRPTTPV